MLAFVFVISGNSQVTEASAKTPVAVAETVQAAVLKNYPTLKVGTSVDDVRKELGKARIDEADSLYYEISDAEVMQIRLDADKKVRVISVTYTHGHKNVLQYSDIFGAGSEVAAKPDGSIYHLARYPDVGYWIAYSRTAGENPSVTVTMQKL